MFIVPVTSPSGDDYIIGPFAEMPDRDTILLVVRASISEAEADYWDEIGMTFDVYELELNEPCVLDFQSVPPLKVL